MITMMIIIMAWELTADRKGALNVPEGLDNAYRKVCKFLDKICY